MVSGTRNPSHFMFRTSFARVMISGCQTKNIIVVVVIVSYSILCYYFVTLFVFNTAVIVFFYYFVILVVCERVRALIDCYYNFIVVDIVVGLKY